MADRPRRSRRQPQELPGHGITPVPVALPEVKLDYGLQDDDADAAGQTSEFVKRLHNMLEQNVYPGIIEWNQGGDAFVVKDMGAFITTVTPRQFKHSNFASFVRQLNKYDFHKIKASEADAADEGKQAWVFRHPHFRAGGEAKLDLIKRKTPSQRKSNASGDALNGLSHEGGDDMREELDHLRVAYQSVTTDMASMQRAMRQQTQLIATLYTRLGEPIPADPPSPDLGKQMALLPGMQNAPLTAAQASHGIAPRPTTRPIDLGTLTVPSIASTQREWDMTTSSYSQNLQWSRDPNDAGLVPESSASAQARAQRQQQQQQQQQQQHQLQPQHSQQQQRQQQPQQMQHNQPIFLQPQPQQDQPKQLLSVPGNASAIYTPMWSTKPRVLLVDDDAVSRTISSKFLSVLGCSFDIAQDGIVALELINQSRYDLVLMDIVMPRLDGLQATTKIRQFDARTPIISMTGNSHPADVVKYMSHGMNDVLCKPFTRDGLVTILEKHLIHLRAVWDLRSIPRSPGLPPMSDIHFSEALAAAPLAPGVNLLASNGVPDEHFASLVQGYQHQHQPQQFGLTMLPPVTVTGKRGWDAAMEFGRPDSPFGNGHDSKRPRFELIE